MPAFVLVHGGAHGAWCWERVVPVLRALPGVEAVRAVDLPGHGARLEAKPQDAIRLIDYVDAVADEILEADLPDVTLVGHSLAGITIPLVAHRLPDRIRHLVHLTTVAPAPGTTVFEALDDPRSPTGRGIDLNAAFCSDLDEASTAWLLARLGPEPPGPLSEPIRTVAGPAGIPATYVFCERDEVLTPDYQREQARRIGVGRTLSIDSGHSPFASQPERLARLLAEADRLARGAVARDPGEGDGARERAGGER